MATTPRSFTTVALRLLGLGLVLGGVLVLPKLFFWHRALMRGETKPTPLYLTGTGAHKMMVVRDAVYSEQRFQPALMTTFTAFALGLILFGLARPLARLVSAGSGTAARMK